MPVKPIAYAVASIVATGAIFTAERPQPTRPATHRAGSAICVIITPVIGPQPPEVCVPDPTR